MMSDAELIRRWAQDRDDAAFRALVERYAGLVHGVAWRRTGGDRLLAEEIVQNVFTVLAGKAARLAGHPTLGAWLHRAAVWECSHARRRETIRRRHLEALAEHTALMSDDSSAAAPATAVEPELDEALAALSESDRRILLLRFFEGRSFREIGTALGKNEATAQRQSSRAVERLAAQLRLRGVAVPMATLAGGLATSLAHSAPVGLAATVVPAALAAGSSLTAAQLLTHTLAMTLHGKHLLSTATTILFVLACLGGSFWLGHSQARAAHLAASAGNAATLAAPDGPRRPPAPYSTTGPRSRRPPLRELLQRMAALHGLQNSTTAEDVVDSLIALGQLQPGDLPAAFKLLPEFKSQLIPYNTLATALCSMLAEESPREAAETLLTPDLLLNGKMPTEAFQEVIRIWLRQEPETALAWGLEQIKQSRVWSLESPRSQTILAVNWLKTTPATVLPRLSEMDVSERGAPFVREVMAQALQKAEATDPLLTHLSSLPDDHYRQLVLEARLPNKNIIPWIAAQSWDGPGGVQQAFRTYLRSEAPAHHQLKILHDPEGADPSFHPLHPEGSNDQLMSLCQGLAEIPPGAGLAAAVAALQEALRGTENQPMVDHYLEAIHDVSLRGWVAHELSR